ncbi:hypothetical protein GCM10007933_36120 [Zoogloea oryzae]|uniref:Uncharacterized protein n=1 Tax=Zoogloea oryzae TaxID=310767 RepID=A0ABQ6FIK4_9RHOO|nr:hypothetical protein [Zoogloea oryzae]GLT24140.1 hypothetical protein GCM10007933_36120 [Zoogloea oryzae]
MAAHLDGAGAPLSFELRGKRVNLRGTGLKPEEKAAKDGKPASGSTA